jgi:hypothetical protein
MFAPCRFDSGALRRKTSAGFASGQGFFLRIADDTCFVNVIAGNSDISSVRNNLVLIANEVSTRALLSDFAALLSGVILISEPTLCPGLLRPKT